MRVICRVTGNAARQFQAVGADGGPSFGSWRYFVWQVGIYLPASTFYGGLVTIRSVLNFRRVTEQVGTDQMTLWIKPCSSIFCSAAASAYGGCPTRVNSASGRHKHEQQRASSYRYTCQNVLAGLLADRVDTFIVDQFAIGGRGGSSAFIGVKFMTAEPGLSVGPGKPTGMRSLLRRITRSQQYGVFRWRSGLCVCVYLSGISSGR